MNKTLYALYLRNENYETIDSTLYCDFDDESSCMDFIIDGKAQRFYSYNNAVLERIDEYFDVIAADLENNTHYYGDNLTDALNTYLPKDKGQYTTKEVHQMKLLMQQYNNESRVYDRWFIADILSVIKGKKMYAGNLCGCSQGDYVNIYYADNCSTDYLNWLQDMFFNTGEEYCIYILDENEFNLFKKGELDLEKDADCNFDYLAGKDKYNVKEYIAREYAGSIDNVFELQETKHIYYTYSLKEAAACN